MAHAGGPKPKLNGHVIEQAEEFVDGKDAPANVLFETEKYLKSCKDAFGYKTRHKVKLPTDYGLARHLGVARSTLYVWAKTNTKFAAVLEKLEDRQADQLINESLAGNYNSTIAKMLLSAKHGIVEKSETNNTFQFDADGKSKKYLKDD